MPFEKGSERLLGNESHIESGFRQGRQYGSSKHHVTQGTQAKYGNFRFNTLSFNQFSLGKETLGQNDSTPNGSSLKGLYNLQALPGIVSFLRASVSYSFFLFKLFRDRTLRNKAGGTALADSPLVVFEQELTTTREPTDFALLMEEN